MRSLVEPGLYEFTKGGGGVLRVGSAHFEFQLVSALGGQAQQIEDAPAIGPIAVAEDPNLDLELLRHSDKLVGRPEVKAKSVANLHLPSQEWHELHFSQGFQPGFFRRVSQRTRSRMDLMHVRLSLPRTDGLQPPTRCLCLARFNHGLDTGRRIDTSR